MKKLYDIAGGTPMLAHHVDEVGSDDDYQTVVAAVTGKLIVPVWVNIYAEGSNGNPTQTLLLRRKSDSFFYIRQQELDAGLSSYILLNFGLAGWKSLASDSDIELYINNKAAQVHDWHCFMGYYLVDH